MTLNDWNNTLAGTTEHTVVQVETLDGVTYTTNAAEVREALDGGDLFWMTGQAAERQFDDTELLNECYDAYPVR